MTPWWRIFGTKLAGSGSVSWRAVPWLTSRLSHQSEISETLTGRVKIDHLHGEPAWIPLAVPVYAFIKRGMDILAALIAIPLFSPLDAGDGHPHQAGEPGSRDVPAKPGGKGNKDFASTSSAACARIRRKAGAQFAQDGDMRVTRVGKVIRKLRIDELPQFFNVLKGT